MQGLDITLAHTTTATPAKTKNVSINLTGEIQCGGIVCYGKVATDMRMLYGMLAGILWVFLMATATAKYGATIPDNIQWLTTVIVVAGAMAGGD